MWRIEHGSISSPFQVPTKMKIRNQRKAETHKNPKISSTYRTLTSHHESAADGRVMTSEAATH